ncbi:MAG: LytR/AlgR family response regulator transcription factor [Faecalimonas umbilicata]|uniref:LytR/AlgR family response regulator transcription factor n=1 Tax=Lachnospiraceae TaxID=186803 RepID=UPI0032B818D6
MLKIAVCDDEKYYRDYIKRLVLNEFRVRKICCEVDLFDSGDKFLELGEAVTKYRIVFLDINMEGTNGIETVKEIRKRTSELYVIFVTAFITYAIEGYKYDVVRYLLKGNDNFEGLLTECIDAILNKINFQVEVREFDFVEGKKNVNLEKIYYIESNLHKVVFWIKEESLERFSLYEKLNRIEEKIKNQKFIRIHQSYLVNMKHIISIKNYKTVLDNGEELPMSKAKFKAAKEAFIEYKGEL